MARIAIESINQSAEALAQLGLQPQEKLSAKLDLRPSKPTIAVQPVTSNQSEVKP